MLAGVAAHAGTLGLSAVTTGALAAYAWGRDEVGARPFAWLTAAFTAYSAAHLAGLLAPPVVRLPLEYAQWTATMAIPVAWLAFALAYTGTDELLTPRVLGAAAAVPAVAALLGWTNGWHGLIWQVNRPAVVDGVTIIVQRFGPAHWIALAYTYACILAGAVVLLRLAVASEYLYADQVALLAVGVAVPVIGSLLSVFRVPPATQIDLTPYTFAVSGLAFGYAAFRHRLFDAVPATRRLGRQAAVADLNDGVVVIDDDRRVVYANDAATEVLDRPPADALGDPVDAMVTLPPTLDGTDTTTEVERGERTYEVRTSAITDRKGRQVGHTLVTREVTERVRRERELRRQRDDLATVERINAVGRAITRAVVGARTREAVVTAVCERLVESGLYDGAWTVTDLDAVSDATAADGPATFEGPPAPVAFGDGGPTGLSPEAGTAAATDERSTHWTTVPLVHGRTGYGALVLATSRPDGVGDRELAVLEELGGLVGRAINAAEKEQLLVADAVLELELAVPDGEAALSTVAARVGAALDLVGLVPTDDGVVVYLDSDAAAAPDEAGDEAATEPPPGTGAPPSGSGADADPSGSEDGAPTTSGAEAPIPGDVAAVRSLEDGSTLEVTLTGGTVLAGLCEVGATIDDLRATPRRCHLVVEVAADTDVRALLDRLERDVPGVVLRARRERERAADAASVAGEAVGEGAVEDLTDRQREALQAAYAAGYFEWPRGSTAEDVADALDIAPPTLHSHLRKAQNKVLAELLDANANTDAAADR